MGRINAVVAAMKAITWEIMTNLLAVWTWTALRVE
jgi:hypothetical protein